MLYIFSILVCGVICGLAQEPPTFSNPVRTRNPPTSTPSSETILRVGDYYYMAEISYDNILVHKSPILTNFEEKPYTTVYSALGGFYQSIDSATIEEVEGSVQITFLVRGILQVPTIYVIRPKDPSNLLGSWTIPKVYVPYGVNSGKKEYIVMKHNGQLYLIGSEDIEDQSTLALYVRPMSDQAVPIGNGTLIHKPTAEWECRMGCSCTRPFVIYNKNVSYVVYTASRDNQYSSLSYISIREGQDPLEPSSWVASPEPVFGSDVGEEVYHVRDASFTLSPDGTETWMFYHAGPDMNYHYTLKPRIERINWNAVTGEPEFPKAHGYSSPQPVPSGQQ